MGFSVSQGEYQKDDSTEINAAIYYCAGEAGAGMFAMMYWKNEHAIRKFRQAIQRQSTLKVKSSRAENVNLKV